MIEDSSFDFDEVSPRSWLDAFPWIQGTADLQTHRWWNEWISDTSFVTRRHRLAQISELAMEHLTSWTIGQIFPGLAPDVDLRELRLPARATNALMREQVTMGSDLMGLMLVDRV